MTETGRVRVAISHLKRSFSHIALWRQRTCDHYVGRSFAWRGCSRNTNHYNDETCM